MTLEISIAELQSKLHLHRQLLETEEAAKTTLVLPFLRALGYDIFNPAEVKPEFTCDVGTKKGEKVDYALCVDGDVRILIECKPVNSELNIKHASQLFRYFAATNARIACLTNGVIYRFHTDSERANMMDEKPFFTFDLENFRNSDLKILASFGRQGFDLERIVAQAGTLKLQSLVVAELKAEFTEPSDDFVRMIAARLHDGRLTEAVREKYKTAIVNSIGTIIREGVNDRLRNAMSVGEDNAQSSPDEMNGEEIETKQIEIDGHMVIRAICSKVIEPARIYIRDQKSYCAILLDDNNRKAIARLHFNSETARYLGLFTGKIEERFPITGPIDIYKFSDAILARIAELESH